MIFKKLGLRNFKRYKDLSEFDLEVKNKNQNIILIEALNGIGKTSFLQAINGCLFGLSESSFKKFLNESREKDELGQYFIEMSLEYINPREKEHIRIYRKYFTKNSDLNNVNLIFEISVNGAVKDISEEDWLYDIEDFIPKEISKFFFFDGERIQQLIDPRNKQELKIANEKK